MILWLFRSFAFFIWKNLSRCKDLTFSMVIINLGRLLDIYRSRQVIPRKKASIFPSSFLTKLDLDCWVNPSFIASCSIAVEQNSHEPSDKNFRCFSTKIIAPTWPTISWISQLTRMFFYCFWPRYKSRYMQCIICRNF